MENAQSISWCMRVQCHRSKEWSPQEWEEEVVDWAHRHSCHWTKTAFEAIVAGLRTWKTHQTRSKWPAGHATRRIFFASEATETTIELRRHCLCSAINKYTLNDNINLECDVIVHIDGFYCVNGDGKQFIYYYVASVCTAPIESCISINLKLILKRNNIRSLRHQLRLRNVIPFGPCQDNKQPVGGATWARQLFTRFCFSIESELRSMWTERCRCYQRQLCVSLLVYRFVDDETINISQKLTIKSIGWNQLW